MGIGGIEGSCTIAGRAGDFVHTLKGMQRAHSPPLEKEVVVKGTDQQAKREGFPNSKRQRLEHMMVCRGEGDGWRRD